MFWQATLQVVSFSAIIRVVGEALRDDPNNGCEGDYIARQVNGKKYFKPNSNGTARLWT